MLLEKGFYVFGEGGVVVDFVVGRFAVVARVDCVDGAFEDARKGTRDGLVILSCDELCDISYFPTLWLFLLLPNRPWIITIGSPLALPASSCSRYARSTTLRLAEAWNERVHDGNAVALGIFMRLAGCECTRDVDKGCILRTSERMLKVW